MKHKIQNTEFKEIELSDGYYTDGGSTSYRINGEEAVKVFVMDDYASIVTALNEYDGIEEATPITKDEFEAELEKAFEIIKEKL